MSFIIHISGLLNEEKVDMGNAKVDIENEKVDIESVLPEKDSNFSVKTTVHIHRLFCECYPNSWPQGLRTKSWTSARRETDVLL